MAAGEEWPASWTVADVLARIDGLCATLSEAARWGDVARAERAAAALAGWRVPVRLAPLAPRGPHAVAALELFAVGCRVEYLSQTVGRWVPAVVLGHNGDEQGSYRLDIHAAAAPAKVRAATGPISAAAAATAASALPAAAVSAPASAPGGGAAGAAPAAGDHGAGVEAALEAATRAMRAFLPESPEARPSAGSPRSGGEPGGDPARRLPPGSAAEYYSSTYGGWVPALVKGFDDRRGTYVLDIQPIALLDKVRPVRGTSDDLAATAPQAAPLPAGPSPVPGVPTQALGPLLAAAAAGAAGRGPGPPPSEPGSPAAPGAVPCGLCGSSGVPAEGLQGLDCGHRFCAACLRGHALGSPDFLQEPVACPLCPATLSRAQLRQAVGEEAFVARQAEMAREDADLAQHLSRELLREEGETRLRFRCPLCLEDGAADGAIELDCRHRLCAECFRSYLGAKISEAQVADDELVCPIPECRTEITVAQVEGATVGDPLWEKFLQFRMNIWTPGADDDKIVECPTSECIKFLVPRDVEFVQCPQCHAEFCARCFRGKHEGVSCVEFEVWEHENADVDRRFEELMRLEQWRRCPVCRAPSERESGCNFMQCRSSTCRKRTYWCYICGKQVPKEEHYTHFPRGPYEDECNTPLEEHVQVSAAPPQEERTAAAEGITMAVETVMEVGGDMLDVLRGWLGPPRPPAARGEALT